MKIEFIKWTDSNSFHSSAGWIPTSAINNDEPQMIDSVGFVWKETETSITLVESIGQECVLGALTIPKIAILERKALAKG